MTIDTQPTPTGLIWIRWIARIWGALILLIALLFLAGSITDWVTNGQADPYAVEDYPFIENLPPLFILLSAVGLGIGWRWERAGGAIALLGQLAALPIYLIHWPIAQDFSRYLIAPYGLSAMVAAPGLLFLISWRLARKGQANAE